MVDITLIFICTHIQPFLFPSVLKSCQFFSPFNLGDRRKTHFIGNMIFAISGKIIYVVMLGRKRSLPCPFVADLHFVVGLIVLGGGVEKKKY